MLPTESLLYQPSPCCMTVSSYIPSATSTWARKPLISKRLEWKTAATPGKSVPCRDHPFEDRLQCPLVALPLHETRPTLPRCVGAMHCHQTSLAQVRHKRHLVSNNRDVWTPGNLMNSSRLSVVHSPKWNRCPSFQHSDIAASIEANISPHLCPQSPRSG